MGPTSHSPGGSPIDLRRMAVRMAFAAAAMACATSGMRMLRAEEIVETAEDGTVVARIQRDEQGRRHGVFERFHPNGRAAVKATYVEDLLHGVERTWDENGVRRSSHAYRKGVLHGAHMTYDEKGHLHLQEAYRDGRREGPSRLYHPGRRRLHVVAAYRAGLLHGKYREWEADGTPRLEAEYREGRLHGAYRVLRGKEIVTSQTWESGVPLDVDGVRPFPRTQAEIRETLARILAGDGPLPSEPLAADRELALRELRAYRYLAGVPHDVTLDPAYDAQAQAAARLCAALGDITHTPSNPGWPEDRFAYAAEGCANCNLHMREQACTSVRGYMDDSDPENISRVGHRCWCLNPAMLRTGFGHEKGFTAMWAPDEGRATSGPSFVAFPPPGYGPGAWMAPHWAWSVSLNATAFDAPGGAVRAVVEPVGADFLPAGPALTLSNEHVRTNAPGLPYVVIFRPEDIALTAERRYRVTVEGLEKNGKSKPLRYYVEFLDHPYVAPQAPRPPK